MAFESPILPTMRPITMELAELKDFVRTGTHLGEFQMRKEYMSAFPMPRISDAELDLIYDYVGQSEMRAVTARCALGARRSRARKSWYERSSLSAEASSPSKMSATLRRRKALSSCSSSPVIGRPPHRCRRLRAITNLLRNARRWNSSRAEE
jgi:hypothetical protein